MSLSCPSQVIINCVCAPDQTLSTVGSLAAAPIRQTLHTQQLDTAAHNRVLTHMWREVQNNNGIKVRFTLRFTLRFTVDQ